MNTDRDPGRIRDDPGRIGPNAATMEGTGGYRRRADLGSEEAFIANAVSARRRTRCQYKAVARMGQSQPPLDPPTPSADKSPRLIDRRGDLKPRENLVTSAAAARLDHPTSEELHLNLSSGKSPRPSQTSAYQRAILQGRAIYIVESTETNLGNPHGNMGETDWFRSGAANNFA